MDSQVSSWLTYGRKAGRSPDFINAPPPCLGGGPNFKWNIVEATFFRFFSLPKMAAAGTAQIFRNAQKSQVAADYGLDG